MPPQKIKAWDKRCTALHEAGHAIVALAVGIPFVRLTLYLTGTKNLLGEKAYTGQTQTMIIHRKAKMKSAMIGYAGVLAEMLDEEFDRDEHDAIEYLDLEVLLPSPTDLKLIDKLHPTWRTRAIKLSSASANRRAL